MAFKQSPNKKARLQDLNKTALIKTVKTLQRRETTLLNKIAKLERAQDTTAGRETHGSFTGRLPRALTQAEISQAASGAAMDDRFEKIATAITANTTMTFPWEIGSVAQVTGSRSDIGAGNNQTECTDVCSERANDCEQEEGA